MRRDTLWRELEQAKAERKANRASQREVNLRILARAALDVERLTGNPEWDIYLQQVEAKNADDRELLAMTGPADPLEYQTPEQVQRTEFERAVIRARIQARNECLEIPKRIVQGTA